MTPEKRVSEVLPYRNSGNGRAGGSAFSVSRILLYRSFVFGVTSTPLHRSSGLLLGAIRA